MSLQEYTSVARVQDSGHKEHDISCGEEGYAALCAGCERNGMRPL